MTKYEKVVEFLGELEGCELRAYLDTRNIPTIGIGTIRYPDGETVKMNDECSLEQASQWCLDHLQKHVFPAVNKLCEDKDVPDRVWIALCSLVYNIGSAVNGTSIKNAMEAQDWNQLAEAFKKYNGQIDANGNKKVIPGLVHRRQEEVNYMLKEDND